MMNQKPTNILIVDDDSIIVLTLKFSLHALGYAVIATASSGPEAIHKAGETRPDLVLMDIDLNSYMDGIEAAAQIKEKFDIPVIYLTGQVEEEVVQRAKISGSFGYLVKPFKDKELHIAIEMALYKHKMESQLKKQDKELKDSLTRIEQAKQEWESTVDSLPQLVCLVDKQQRVIRANRMMERWNLGQVTHLKGQTIHELLHPDCAGADCYLPIFIKQAWKTLMTPLLERDKNEETITGYEIEDKILNRYLRLQAYPSLMTTHQQDKEMSSFAVVVIEDITERKRLEEQLHQSQKMEAVGRLAGGVAHDFNNILMAITGDCELLLTDLKATDPIRRDIEHIRQNAERGAALTKQLLAFGRKMVIRPQELNLNEILVNMGKLLSRFIGENINLLTVTAPQLGRIKADANQIEQIIMNLIINARDAMPQGGKLVIETANVILPEADALPEIIPGHYIKLTVSDTGTGIKPEDLPYIFDPFFTTKEMGKGTGLGLATVHGIVKQNNGYITVDSQPEQGTIFKVYLPKIEAMINAPQLAAPILPAQTDSGSETILLVEDEIGVGMVIRRLLRKKGYEVLTAMNGQEAIKVCQNYIGPIHLMITDIVMPQGMNGQELAEYLKPLYPTMKVLFMSGYTDNDLVHQKMLKSSTAFLQKPFALNDLAKKVSELLNSE